MVSKIRYPSFNTNTEDNVDKLEEFIRNNIINASNQFIPYYENIGIKSKKLPEHILDLIKARKLVRKISNKVVFASWVFSLSSSSAAGFIDFTNLNIFSLKTNIIILKLKKKTDCRYLSTRETITFLMLTSSCSSAHDLRKTSSVLTWNSSGNT